MAENKPLTAIARVVFGLLFVGVGNFPMFASFDIGPLRSSDINGRRGSGWRPAACSRPGASRCSPASAPVRDLMVFSPLLALAALGNWVAFGAGERVCTGTSLTGIELGGSLRGVACGIPFAVAGRERRALTKETLHKLRFPRARRASTATRASRTRYRRSRRTSAARGRRSGLGDRGQFTYLHGGVTITTAQ